MRALTLADFEPRVGEPLEIATSHGPMMLILGEAQALASSGRAGGSFRLEFEGPLQPILPQSIYAFPLGEERCDIFIVPLGPRGGTMRYEAVFF